MHRAPASLAGMVPRLRAAWLVNPRVELLAGLVVAIALIRAAVDENLAKGEPRVRSNVEVLGLPG